MEREPTIRITNKYKAVSHSVESIPGAILSPQESCKCKDLRRSTKERKKRRKDGKKSRDNQNIPSKPSQCPTPSLAVPCHVPSIPSLQEK
jgi:hypothetical protein